MTDDRDDPLLTAVEKLTKPIRSKVMQGEAVSHVELPPLLVQLDSSIRSSMGGTAAGASLAFEGAPLNTAALFKAMKISSQVIDWCHAMKIKPVRNTRADLLAWYAAFTQTPPDPTVERYRTKVLHGWARSIEEMLNPPRERELPDACPTCEATEWWDMKTGAKYARPLVVRYRPGDDDLIGDAKGFCRACETVWGARQLSFELEEKTRHTG